MKKRLIAFALMCMSSLANAELQPINNDELDGEVAQAGIAMSLEMRLNTDSAGNSLCGTTALPVVECRLAIGLNNRGRPTIDQEWLVFKGVYGLMYIPRLTLDADKVTYTSDVDGSSQSIAALKIGFGGAANKVQIRNLTITNMSMEFDTSAAARGYLANSTGVQEGFLGMRINGDAEISGSLKIFPCSANHPRC